MSKSIRIPNGIITLADTEFKCPYCKKQYDDIDNKYLDRCNKNKSCTTTIKCKCKHKFGFTYNIMGDAVSFKL